MSSWFKESSVLYELLIIMPASSSDEGESGVGEARWVSV
jgi:hypothetical protein